MLCHCVADLSFPAKRSHHFTIHHPCNVQARCYGKSHITVTITSLVHLYLIDPCNTRNFWMQLSYSTSACPSPIFDTCYHGFLSIVDCACVCRTFGGYARGFFNNKNYWAEELEKLKGALTRDGKKFDSENFYTTAYDSPYKFYDRHNEVWLTKIEE